MAYRIVIALSAALVLALLSFNCGGCGDKQGVIVDAPEAATQPKPAKIDPDSDSNVPARRVLPLTPATRVQPQGLQGQDSDDPGEPRRLRRPGEPIDPRQIRQMRKSGEPIDPREFRRMRKPGEPGEPGEFRRFREGRPGMRQRPDDERIRRPIRPVMRQQGPAQRPDAERQTDLGEGE